MGTLSINFSGRGTRDHVVKLEQELAAAQNERQRISLQAALSIALIEAAPGRARAIATQTLAQAEHCPETAAHAAALVAAGVVFAGPESSELRCARAQQALDICTGLGERDTAETAWFVLLGALAEVGDFARIDRELSPKFTSLGPFQELLDGRHAAWIRSMRATVDGRADDAEQLAGHGYALAVAAGDPDAETVLRGQLAVIRWLQGRESELVDPLLEARQLFPNEPVWHAALAWVWFKRGSAAPATEVLKTLTGVTGSPRDRNWLAAVAITAEVVAEIGTLDQAHDLYGALAPYSGRLAMIGHGITCWGPVSRALACLAKRLGDSAAAERYLREAISTSAKLGAQVWLAGAQLELSQFLRENGGSTEEARALALESATLAHRIGPPSVEVPARKLLQQLSFGSAAPDAIGDRALEHDTVARAPEIWLLGRFRIANVRGEPIVWRSRKAELLLKVLISRRGANIPREQLMDLVWPGSDPGLLANRFAVAISTIRRSLDPDRVFAHDHFLETDSDLVLIRDDRMTVDSERFLGFAQEHIREALARREEGRVATDQEHSTVWEALKYAQEPAFASDRDALWAERVRRDIEATYSELAHLCAGELRAGRAWHRAAELYRHLLALDVYDEPAYAGLVECLAGQGAHGQAREAWEQACRVLAEIGVSPRRPKSTNVK